MVFTLLGYTGTTSKVTARELPEYGHYVFLSFVKIFWQICGISQGAEPFCVHTGPDVENVNVPTTNPPSRVTIVLATFWLSVGLYVLSDILMHRFNITHEVIAQQGYQSRRPTC